MNFVGYVYKIGVIINVLLINNKLWKQCNSGKDIFKMKEIILKNI